MKTFMSLSLFILGLLSILLGLALIIRDRLVSKTTMRAAMLEEKISSDAITSLINALANFAEKLFGQFASQEKLPVFLITIGLVMCGFGWWLIG